MAQAAFKRDGKTVGVRVRVHRPRQEAGRPAPVRPGDPGGPSVDGQNRAGDQHRLQRGEGLPADARRRRAAASTSARAAEDGGVVGFFSLEMSAEQLATRILAEESARRRTRSAAAR